MKIITGQEANEGDLILRINKSFKHETFVVGIFQDISQEYCREKKIGIKYPLRLEPNIGILRVIYHRYYNPDGSPWGFSHRKDVEYHFGKKDITKSLEDNPDYKSHINWISSLNKPYNIEDISEKAKPLLLNNRLYSLEEVSLALKEISHPEIIEDLLKRLGNRRLSQKKL